MCRIMINSSSRDLIFGFKDRNEKLQQIQTLTKDVENNERKIVKIDNKIKTSENIIKDAENIIKDAENIIKDAEKTIAFTQKKIDANNQVIKDTEALIDAVQKRIDTGMELMDCYKSLIANNESPKNSSTVNSNPPLTVEERLISMTAYEKAKQDLVDLNLDLKINHHPIKIVKKSSVTNNQSVDDSKTRITAYNILNDCFNNFRLKYLSSMRWF